MTGKLSAEDAFVFFFLLYPGYFTRSVMWISNP